MQTSVSHLDIRAEWQATNGLRRCLAVERGRAVVLERQSAHDENFLVWRHVDPVPDDLMRLLGPPIGVLPADHLASRAEDRLAAEFEEFWSAYPKGHKVKKPDAMKAWKQTLKTRPYQKDLIAALERWKTSDGWTRGYVPYPATWLRARMWETPPPPPPQRGSTVAAAPAPARDENAANLAARFRK